MPSYLRVRLVIAEAAPRRSLAARLADAGFSVEEAEALGQPEADPTRIHVFDVDGQPEGMWKEVAGPLLLLTANPAQLADAPEDMVLAKPVRPSALAARLTELAQLSVAAPEAIGPYRFDPHARTLERPGQRIRLTDKETAILAFLATQGRPVGREELLERVWGYGSGMTTHTLETHIYRLRRKIEPDTERATLLLTEPGGYRLAL
jgi:DNA-binding response OmpR family regulator